VNVLTNQGKYEQVEKIHRQSLGPREAVLGKEYHDTLIGMNNSAAALSNQGRYEKAKQTRCWAKSILTHWGV
jgi:hypothetical protein